MATKLRIYKLGENENPNLSSLRRKNKDDETVYEAFINPNNLSFGASISYGNSESASGSGGSGGASGQPVGEAYPQLVYKGTNPETLSFKLMLDGTGVVTDESGEEDFVSKEIDKLRKITYYYDGDAHEPGNLLVAWGDFAFMCRLKSLNVNYKAFDNHGKAIRCEVNLQFAGSTRPEEARRMMNQNSPDLSHVRVVKAGDTLPLMCQRIYGSSKYYLQVARINGLENFRDLRPGSEILFPPIQK